MENQTKISSLNDVKTELLKISNLFSKNTVSRWIYKVLTAIMEITVYSLIPVIIILFITVLVKGNASIYKVFYPGYNSYTVEQIEQLDILWNGLKTILFFLAIIPMSVIALLFRINRKKEKKLETFKNELNKIIEKID